MDEEFLVSRRSFVGLAAAGVVRLSTRGAARGAAARGGDAAEALAYVGTYTHDGPSRGIYRLRVGAAGALRLDGVAAATPDPSFVAVHPSGRFVYAVNELTEFDGAPSGAVSAFARDPAAGTLTPLNQRASGGGAPCYVTVDRAGRFALVANYVGGSVATLPIGADGRLGEIAALVQHRGSGPNRERQEGPHAHSITLDPLNRFALVADLGLDRLMVYRFDARTGALAAAGETAARPGAGPRHLAFHPNGRLVYVVNELESSLTTYRYDGERGALSALQTLSLRAAGRTNANTGADVHVLPSGRFVYASNRGDDSIAVFAVDPSAGTLAPVQQRPTDGRVPRNFALDPTGRFLLAANQQSNAIVSFAIDARSGRLAPTGARVAVPAPVCVRFADARAR
jgi:6-phosphogluconolactonase